LVLSRIFLYSTPDFILHPCVSIIITFPNPPFLTPKSYIPAKAIFVLWNKTVIEAVGHKAV
jgi:hypothetical protein